MPLVMTCKERQDRSLYIPFFISHTLPISVRQTSLFNTLAQFHFQLHRLQMLPVKCIICPVTQRYHEINSACLFLLEYTKHIPYLGWKAASEAAHLTSHCPFWKGFSWFKLAWDRFLCSFPFNSYPHRQTSAPFSNFHFSVKPSL